MTINFKGKKYKLINGMFFEYNEQYKLIAADHTINIYLDDEFSIEEPKKDNWFKRLFKRG
jgi:stalled ribosome rescue protein Dom34